MHYPINNYDVSLNIGDYEHFSDKLGDLPLDFYALPEDLEKAKSQFAQAKGMLEAYQHYFGEYPFKKDGYKLIEAPYTGMEHQSAVTYGNRFINGYGDATGRASASARDSTSSSSTRARTSGSATHHRCRPFRYVDSRGLGDVPRVPVCGVSMGQGRWHEVSQRV